MNSIKLTEKQSSILLSIANGKSALEQEYAKLKERESELLVILTEAAGIEVTGDSKIDLTQEEGEYVLVVSEPEAKTKELKKTTKSK